MLSSCKVLSIIITLLLLANLESYGITFDSKGSPTDSDKSNLLHTSSNDYPYIVTIDPESEKAVDDKSCHPTRGGEQSVPCKTL